MITVVVSPDSPRAPRLWWRTVGAIAAATLGSGPLLMLWFTLVIGLTDPDIFASNVVGDPAGYARELAESSIKGSIVSLPAALAHAVIIVLLARRARDAFGWSMASGAVLGVLAAGLFTWIVFASGEAGGFDSLENQLFFTAGAAGPFASTGALMGLLYWRIAIRPRRRWRRLRQHSEDAIRVME